MVRLLLGRLVRVLLVVLVLLGVVPIFGPPETTIRGERKYQNQHGRHALDWREVFPPQSNSTQPSSDNGIVPSIMEAFALEAHALEALALEGHDGMLGAPS